MTKVVNVLQVPTGIIVPESMLEAQERLLARFHPEDPPRASRLQSVIDSDKSALIFAVIGNGLEGDLFWPKLNAERYVGTLTLLELETSTRLSGYIEHVVVEEAHEGRGIGSLLVKKAIEVAENKGMSRLDLTSSATKQSAQRLYQKMGFLRRETNNWRLEL
ncbi:MAG TPA: GNAT family N-acetyltransferase [Candidatus Binatia bacterium]|nr:GNAT family N-acetyltransferase [Candidatus Binatia bacterium]